VRPTDSVLDWFLCISIGEGDRHRNLVSGLQRAFFVKESKFIYWETTRLVKYDEQIQPLIAIINISGGTGKLVRGGAELTAEKNFSDSILFCNGVSESEKNRA